MNWWQERMASPPTRRHAPVRLVVVVHGLLNRAGLVLRALMPSPADAEFERRCGTEQQCLDVLVSQG